MPTDKPIKEVIDTLPQTGQLDLITVRPARRAVPETVKAAEVTVADGLIGDHYSKSGGKRQVTLIQAEHLDAVGGLLGRASVDPLLTRRNLVVSGINLLALKDRRFRIGNEVVLEYTSLCHPCTRMEENFGPGGYNAMRGHGGICARVVKGGRIRKGDLLMVEIP